MHIQIGWTFPTNRLRHHEEWILCQRNIFSALSNICVRSRLKDRGRGLMRGRCPVGRESGIISRRGICTWRSWGSRRSYHRFSKILRKHAYELNEMRTYFSWTSGMRCRSNHVINIHLTLGYALARNVFIINCINDDCEAKTDLQSEKDYKGKVTSPRASCIQFIMRCRVRSPESL
jgi:hypothetical protein